MKSLLLAGLLAAALSPACAAPRTFSVKSPDAPVHRSAIVLFAALSIVLGGAFKHRSAKKH